MLATLELQRISLSRRSSAAEISSRTGPSARRSTSDSRKPSTISDLASAGVEPTGGEVEELVAVDLRDRRGVGAADVVGLDLEAGDGIGVGVGGEEQVAALLEGVGLLRAGVDPDHAAPDGGRPGGEDAAEGEVGVGVRRRVLLGRVEVEVLSRPARVAAGDAGLRPGAREVGLHPHLAAARAEAERGPIEPAVTLDLRPLAGEDPGPLGDVLRADVAQGGRLADVQLDDRVEQRIGLVAGRGCVLPYLRLGALLEHDDGAPSDRRAVLVEGQRDPDRLAQLDPGAARGPARRRASRPRCARRTGPRPARARRACSRSSSPCDSRASASGTTVAPSAASIVALADATP